MRKIVFLILFINQLAWAANEPPPIAAELPESTQPELKKGEKKIKHPLSKKGLIRITKDSEYIYKTEESPKTGTTTILFANWDPINLANPSNGVSYADIYDRAFILMADYEWPLMTLLGSWNFKLGSGLGISSGNGILTHENDSSTSPAKEAFTLLTFPNHASVIYRIKFWDDQPIIPYIEGGLAYYTFLEMRDDKIGPQPGRLAGSLGVQVIAGGAFDLGFFNRNLIKEMDAEYGINGVFVNLEYRKIQGLKPDFDISSDLISFGFMLIY
ncbi:MAG: hypothetical protein KDD50_08825 [Bdellovibrionales bacterium]|nr:hypothetical protein [Bdellovibrionales bacterium]